MSETLSTDGDGGKPDAGESDGKARQMLRSNARIIDCARGLFPVKTALHLVEITGYPLRTVERWLTGEVKIPSDAFVSVLHSDYGRDFLAAVMTAQTPRWWLQLKAFIGAVDLAVAQRKHRRKMRELLDAEYGSQISAAQRIQDEDDFCGPSAAVREVDHRVVRGKAR